jgi:predicted Zn-dependent peptidase
LKIFIWFFALFVSTNIVASDSVDPYKNILYYKLDNGLQVYLLSDKKAENSQILLTVKVGYDLEDDRNYGLSHLVEHMVFRDQRVPHHDYLDYLKDEGATYVNGFTKRYETGYTATIDSNRSYWIAKTFADMVFDKNVTIEDIDIERGALQTEIGEPHWYNSLLINIAKFFEKITPTEESIYQDEFSLTKPKDIPTIDHARKNNKKFTFDEIIKHYDRYYYPANMTLTIVGNFSIDEMKKVIKDNYGKIKKSGSATTTKPPRDAELNHKPYNRYYEGMNENSAYIGIKYILDDYKKYLILDIYTTNLAQRLQQYIRNKLGKTYSVNSYEFSDRDAGIFAISFGSLHSDFQDNIDIVKRTIASDMVDINDTTISDAFRSYEQNSYLSKEHDSDTLISLVEMSKYLREDLNITDRTSYEIFNSITNKEFRDTIRDAFIPENGYSFIYRDYYFFPMEMLLLSILSVIIFVLIYTRVYLIAMKRAKILYTQRDILMSRRVSNRVIGFVILMITMLIVSVVLEWIKYLIFDLLFGDPYYLMTLDVPYSYIGTVLDIVLYLVLFMIFYINLWSYYARIDVIRDAIVAIGNRVEVLRRDDIDSISIVPWSWRYKNIIGKSIFFWRPLVSIEMRDGSHYYIRSTNAEHLVEDLERWRVDSSAV